MPGVTRIQPAMEIFSPAEVQFPAVLQRSQAMALGIPIVYPDEALAVFGAGGGALDGHDAHARSAARVWPSGVMGLGLGLVFRVRILLPAREPSFTQVALNRSKCNGNREIHLLISMER